MRVVYIERNRDEFAVRVLGVRTLAGTDGTLVRTFPDRVCAELYADHAAGPNGVIVNLSSRQFAALEPQQRAAHVAHQARLAATRSKAV